MRIDASVDDDLSGQFWRCAIDYLGKGDLRMGDPTRNRIRRTYAKLGPLLAIVLILAGVVEFAAARAAWPVGAGLVAAGLGIGLTSTGVLLSRS